MSEVLVTAERIATLVRNLATAMCCGRPLLLVPIMTGGIVFCADLLRVLPDDTRVVPALLEVEGKVVMPALRAGDRQCDIWIVDNTICTGWTLQRVLRALPAGSRSVVLFGLPAPRRVVQPSLVGVEVPACLVAGYGADFCQTLRGLPELRELRGGS